MKNLDPRRGDIRNRVRAHLIEAKLNANFLENYRKIEQLQNAALLCKLFNKKVKLTVKKGDALTEMLISAYLVSRNLLVLRNGQSISLSNIQSIEMV
ncbi:MAG: hypothetical protein SFW35_14375 [Chitinophagales bacterium]|nr:hypothetical protein [Chitinophagales bacterium]